MSKKRLALLLIVAGVGLASYAAAALVFVKQSGVTPEFSWLAQTGACLAAGVAAACWGFTVTADVLAPATSRVEWGKKRPYRPPPRPDPATECSQKNLFDPKLIDLEEQRDLSALHHLAERVRDNHEALALCKQLQDCIFELHHGGLDDGDPAKKTFTSSVEVRGGATTIKRESVAEVIEPPAVEHSQGAFFL